MAHEGGESNRHLLELQAIRSEWVIEARATRISPAEIEHLDFAAGTRKVIHFIRHGEGEHNLAKASSGKECDCSGEGPGVECPYLDPKLEDPPLTPKGVEQAEAAAADVKRWGESALPSVIYSSPLQRALHTAQIAFSGQIKLDENAREQYGLHICDKRRDTRDIIQQFASADASGLSAVDELYTADCRESKRHVSERAHAVLKTVRESPANVIALASHSSFLLTFFNTCLDCTSDPTLYTWFSTGELRSVLIEF